MLKTKLDNSCLILTCPKILSTLYFDISSRGPLPSELVLDFYFFLFDEYLFFQMSSFLQQLSSNTLSGLIQLSYICSLHSHVNNSCYCPNESSHSDEAIYKQAIPGKTYQYQYELCQCSYFTAFVFILPLPPRLCHLFYAFHFIAPTKV